MQRSRLINRQTTRALAMLFLGLLLLLSVVASARPQSGRRPPKPPTSPDPIPPKNQEPPIAPPSEESSKNRIPIKVVSDQQGIHDFSFYTSTVQRGCAERLSQSHSVQASYGKGLNRKQASDAAKSSDMYVLRFELEVDVAYADRGTIGAMSPETLFVKYEVFTRGTGKTKTTGQIYQRARGPGGVPVPLPRGPASAEYMLRDAGREMADRLLDTLNLSRPSGRN